MFDLPHQIFLPAAADTIPVIVELPGTVFSCDVFLRPDPAHFLLISHVSFWEAPLSSMEEKGTDGKNMKNALK